MSRSVTVAAGLALLLGLGLSSLYSYLLFHTLAELFSVVIASAVFVIAWNARRFLANDYLLFLGVAYLAVAALDVVHTLAYRGMNVFPGVDTDPATQLWVAARGVEALSLLAGPVFFHRRLPARTALLGYGAVVAGVLAAVATGAFPTTFVEGVGLTPFKTAAEYTIAAVLVAAALHLYAERERCAPVVLRCLLVSIGLSVASELAFTLYVDAYGLLNQVGHLLKVGAVYFVYRALIVTGLREPYDLLFRELRQSEALLADDVARRERAEAALRELNAALEQRVEERTARVRSLALALTEAEVRERRRIAALLHDHHQQLLVAAKMAVDGIGRAAADPAAVARAADRADGLLAEAIASSRSLSHELSPPVLRQQGLAAALRWLGDELRTRHGLAVEVAAADDVAIASEPVRVFLFEAARELLFNVVKHAGVAAARVALDRDDGGLHLTVSDDGRGLDPAAFGPDGAGPAGFGLTEIRERMSLLGGSLDVDGAPGRGASFRLSVPTASLAAVPPDGAVAADAVI